MIAELVRGALGLPLRIVSYSRGLLRLALNNRPVPPYVLPVAGLDEGKAHGILFALRQAAKTSDELQLSQKWAEALQLSQVASDRVLNDLKILDRTLTFWVARLKEGQHNRFMLFNQGPLSFFKDVIHACQRLFTSHIHVPKKVSATDKIEKRVAVLRSLRGHVCEALAQIHASAAALHLHLPQLHRAENGDSISAFPSSQFLSAEAERSQLFNRVQDSVAHAVQGTVQAWETLATCINDLPSNPEEPAHASSQADLVRDAAVESALRKKSRRMFRIGIPPPIPHDEQPVGQRQTESAEEALEEAKRTVGVQTVVQETTSANILLAQAALIATRAPSVVLLPTWVRMPSRYKRHWVRYCFLSVATTWATLFVYRHSRLNGSRDIEIWTKASVDALWGAYRQHVLKPLLQLRDELFRTFRARRGIVDSDEFEADKASLVRMLEDFEQDVNRGKIRVRKRGGEAADTSETGMNLMMRCYEDELKHPVRNVVNGQLARSLLIQVQKLKVDTESAMLELDQLLKANELTLAIVAAIPAFIFGAGAIVVLWRWLTPTPPDAKYEALPCRMAMVELERVLTRLSELGTAQDQGLMVLRIAKVQEEAYKLFARHSLVSSHSEWPNLRQDLVELAAPTTIKQKVKLCGRMLRVYTIFKF